MKEYRQQEDLNQSIQQEEVKCPDGFHFVYDKQNPETLMLLKNKDQIYHKNWQKDSVFLSNFIEFNYKESTPRKQCLNFMIKKPACAQMAYQFCNLAKKYYDTKEVNDFIERFQSTYFVTNQNECAKLFFLEYTKQNFFHKFINNFLRSSQEVSEICYLHFFVKGLHKVIQDIYSTYAEKQKKEFVCYRGACMKQQQILKFKNNIGKNMENLGFLSASLNPQVAMEFAYNVVIVIEVHDQQRSKKFDSGYAFLNNEELSQLPLEEQVLFNALTLFLVKDVKQKIIDGISYVQIQLIYGNVAAIVHNYEKNKYLKMDRQAEQIVTLARVHMQSNAVYLFDQFRRQGIAYYEKLVELYKKYQMNQTVKQCKIMLLKGRLLYLYTYHNIKSIKAQKLKKQLQTMDQIYDATSYARQLCFIIALLEQAKNYYKIDQYLIQNLLQRIERCKIFVENNYNEKARFRKSNKSRHITIILYLEIDICKLKDSFCEEQLMQKVATLKQQLIKSNEGQCSMQYLRVLSQELQLAFQCGYPVQKLAQIMYQYNLKMKFCKQNQQFKMPKFPKQLKRQIITKMNERKYEQAIDLALESAYSGYKQSPSQQKQVQQLFMTLIYDWVKKLKICNVQYEQSIKIFTMIKSKVKYNKQFAQSSIVQLRNLQLRVEVSMQKLFGKILHKLEISLPIIQESQICQLFKKYLSNKSHVWITYRLLMALHFQMCGQYEQSEDQIERLISQVGGSEQLQQLFTIYIT